MLSVPVDEEPRWVEEGTKVIQRDVGYRNTVTLASDVYAIGDENDPLLSSGAILARAEVYQKGEPGSTTGYCTDIKIDGGAATAELMSAVLTFGLVPTANSVRRNCFIDSDKDGQFDRLAIVGAPSKEFIDVKPVIFRTSGPRKTKDEQPIKLVYNTLRREKGEITFSLATGTKFVDRQTFANSRRTISIDEELFPMEVQVHGVKLLIHEIDSSERLLLQVIEEPALFDFSTYASYR